VVVEILLLDFSLLLEVVLEEDFFTSLLLEAVLEEDFFTSLLLEVVLDDDFFTSLLLEVVLDDDSSVLSFITQRTERISSLLEQSPLSKLPFSKISA
jgi:hypothetical protein